MTKESEFYKDLEYAENKIKEAIKDNDPKKLKKWKQQRQLIRRDIKKLL